MTLCLWRRVCRLDLERVLFLGIAPTTGVAKSGVRLPQGRPNQGEEGSTADLPGAAARKAGAPRRAVVRCLDRRTGWLARGVALQTLRQRGQRRRAVQPGLRRALAAPSGRARSRAGGG